MLERHTNTKALIENCFFSFFFSQQGGIQQHLDELQEKSKEAQSSKLQKLKGKAEKVGCPNTRV